MPKAFLRKPMKKKFGQRITKPGALEDQILDGKFAKPTKRINTRDARENAPTKKKFVNMTGVLAQMHELEQDVRDDKQAQEGDHVEEGEEEEEEEEEAALPENFDNIIKDFLKSDMQEVDMAEEEKIFASFMPENKETVKTHMEQIRETLVEKHTELQTQIDEQSVAGGPSIAPAVQEMCRKAGKVLSNYRAGPVPKMIKAMPKMRNWLHLVYYTCPDHWSAAAMYQLTRVFCSQKPEMVQAFYTKVLLPRCRDDIAEYKRLNYHLYQALSKALFKPAAFFKGIILPLCMSGTCTLREAVVFGSIVARKKIPLRASAAAIMKIAQMQYTGANSIFLRILLNKKYALYWTVIDATCEHFVRFKCDDRHLPVLWHQALLTFVQRYKEDISEDQRKQLYGLAAFHSHKIITPEMRRELENSTTRR